MVPSQLMSISGKELHVSVLPLHVPERPFLGRGHPNGLGRGLRSLGLSPRRGRLGRGSLWRLRGLGSRCWDGLFGRHRLRRLGLVLPKRACPIELYIADLGWVGWGHQWWVSLHMFASATKTKQFDLNLRMFTKPFQFLRCFSFSEHVRCGFNPRRLKSARVGIFSYVGAASLAAVVS